MKLKKKLIRQAGLLLFLPVSIALYFGTASLRAEQALKHASLADLQFQAQQDPNDARIAYYLGLRAQALHKDELALDSFTSAATLAPHDETIWLAWAHAAARIRGSQEALDILSTFLQVHPHCANAHLMAAQILSQLGEQERAYAEARAAAREEPSNAQAWRLAGTAALAAHNYYVAEENFRRSLALAPGDWANPQGIGDALYSSARYQDSVKYYREASRLAPEMGVTHLTLGEALLRTANSPAEFEAARASLRQALAERDTLASDGQFLLFLSLGQSYCAEGQWQEALPWLKQALPYEPANAIISGEVHFELARAYRGLHDSANAAREMSLHALRMRYNVQIRTLSDRIRAHPDNTQAYVDLARLYAAHHDVADAADLYRQALAREPGLKSAQQEYAALLREQPVTDGGGAIERAERTPHVP